MHHSMECIIEGKCGHNCPYHKWLEAIKDDKRCGIAKPDLIYTLTKFVREGSTDKTRRLTQIGRYIKKRRVDTNHGLGVTRLLTFLRTTDTFRTCPWSSSRFDVNESIYMRLCAAHLHIIVGAKEAKEERTQLLMYLNQYGNLETQRNLIWITNRLGLLACPLCMCAKQFL